MSLQGHKKDQQEKFFCLRGHFFLQADQFVYKKVFYKDIKRLSRNSFSVLRDMFFFKQNTFPCKLSVLYKINASLHHDHCIIGFIAFCNMNAVRPIWEPPNWNPLFIDILNIIVNKVSHVMAQLNVHSDIYYMQELEEIRNTDAFLDQYGNTVDGEEEWKRVSCYFSMP